MNEDVSEAQYAIRFHLVAMEDFDRETKRYYSLFGEKVASEWGTGLLQAIQHLSYQAPFLALATGDALFPFPVRVMRYQRRRGAPIYRILLTVIDDEDGPHVLILTIRHGARAPMTSEETTALTST